MSFRSRSRTTEPLASRRRSLSSTRAGSTNTGAGGMGSYNYNGTISNPYSVSSTARPLSTGYYQNGGAAGPTSSASSYYQSPYASIYSSRENLYSPANTSSARNGGSYYSNGNGRYEYTASAASSSSAYLTSSTATNNKPRSSKPSYLLHKHITTTSTPSSSAGLTITNATLKHISFPKSSNSNNYSHSAVNAGTGGGGGGGGYESRYASNPYNSDRYISPYSSYDNGVTTVSLSFNMGNAGGVVGKSNSFRGSNPYLNKAPSSSSSSGRNSAIGGGGNMLKTKSLSISNSSLNAVGGTTGSTYATPTSSAAAMAAIVTRSNSLREQERKSRNRTRSRSAAQRSLSASSEKSEGYESGTDRGSRSRVGSVASMTDDSKSRERSENGDTIDYKALWEAASQENEKLRQQLKKKDDEIAQTRATLERVANATSKHSLSELEKRERRAMERKLSEMEEELKQLESYKTENVRLKEENGALIRVISKLSK